MFCFTNVPERSYYKNKYALIWANFLHLLFLLDSYKIHGNILRKSPYYSESAHIYLDTPS